jgi:chromosome segregation ATPase
VTRLEAAAEKLRLAVEDHARLEVAAAQLREQRDHLNRERQALLDQIETAEVKVVNARGELLRLAAGDAMGDTSRCPERHIR